MVDSSDNSKQNTAKDLGAYSVSSAANKPKRSVTITMPTMPRPKMPNVTPPTGPKGKRLRTGMVAIAFIAVAAVSGFAGAALQSNTAGDGLSEVTLQGEKKIVTQESQLISQIAKTVGPSVVSVNTNIQSESPYSLYGFGDGTQTSQAAGTGIIISESGYIVTNRHVVPEGTTSVSITLSDGTELKSVEVVGRTSTSDSLDVAFLKVKDTEGHKLKAATIGDSSKVQVGDNVVAIGNALGQFQNTVTSGIISGYGRSVQAGDGSGDASSVENLDNLFQTDAAINQGNSGGPLVNLNAQVIGINTAVAGDGAQNIGFAIPINDIKGMLNQVLKSGKLSRPYLGVRYVPLSADVSKEYNLSTSNGAFIVPSSGQTNSSIIPDGPADKAGLREKDIITAVDGKKVDEAHSLTSLLGAYQPGDKVQLTVIRDGKEITISATLGEMPTAQ